MASMEFIIKDASIEVYEIIRDDLCERLKTMNTLPSTDQDKLQLYTLMHLVAMRSVELMINAKLPRDTQCIIKLRV